MKTDTSLSTKRHSGQVPFLFRQKSLMTVSGHTLRPGGYTLTSRAVDFCGFEPGDPVLDAGCGFGMTTRYLNETYGIRSVGCDADAGMVDRARRCTGDAVPFVHSRMPRLPFGSGSFRGIFCECVLSLIPDKSCCLSEFFRILAPNGRLVLTDLYIPHLLAQRRQTGNSPTATRVAGSEGPGSRESGACLDGALPLLDLMRLMETAGFQIDILEDHTRLLKQLAGQISFQHGSSDNFQERFGENPCAGGLKPGYCMIVAGKYD